MLSERSQQTREKLTSLSLNCRNSARDVPALLGIEMLDHKWTRILIYEIHPDLQV